MEYTIT
jgi:hypothetical protein